MAFSWRVISSIYESERARRAGVNWLGGEFAPNLDYAGRMRERATSYRARVEQVRDSLPVDVRKSIDESENAQVERVISSHPVVQ